jgi:hypothetical protein
MDNVIYVTFQLTQHFRFSILNYLIRSLHCYKKKQSGFREGRLLNVWLVFHHLSPRQEHNDKWVIPTIYLNPLIYI